MAQITDDVQFTVNVADRVIAGKSFGSLGIVAPHIKSRNRYLRFSDTADLATLFPATDPVNIAVTAAFDQKSEAGQISDVNVLRQLVDTVDMQLPAPIADTGDVLTFTVTSAVENIVYQVDVVGFAGGGPISHTATGSDTVITIAAALVVLFNTKQSATHTAADNADGTFTITSDVADTPFVAVALTADVFPTPTSMKDFNDPNLISVVGGLEIKFNGVAFHSTTESTSTNIEVVALFKTAVDEVMGPVGGGLSDNADGSFELTINPADATAPDFMTVEVTSEFTIFLFNGAPNSQLLARGTLVYHKPSATETAAETLQAVTDENDDFYLVTTLSADATIIADFASSVTSLVKLYMYQGVTTDYLDAADSTDLASVFKSQSRNRVIGLFDNDPIEFSDMAWAGDRLPPAPGTATWKFKVLVGITPDPLTSAQESTAAGKNLNVYTPFGTSSATREGVTATGRFIDVQRSADFIEDDLNVAVANLIANPPKVPDTDAGRAQIEAVIRNRASFYLEQGITGPLKDSPSGEIVRIFIPSKASQSSADAATRTVSGIIVELQLAGAIHKVIGTVNVSV